MASASNELEKKAKLPPNIVALSNMCLRCFGRGHRKADCDGNGVVTCDRCYGMNYLSRECCVLGWKPLDEYYQCFRMVGIQHTRFFTDLKIGNKMVAAMIDTNRTTTVIDPAVVYKLLGSANNLPSAYLFKTENYHPCQLTCLVEKLDEDLRIILGMDFLGQRHVNLHLNGVELHSTLNGLPSRAPSARYIITVTMTLKEVSATIDTSCVRSKVDRSIANHILMNATGHTYNPRTKILTTEMMWNNKTVRMPLEVVDFGSEKLILGTDFLKCGEFAMKLDGITQNLKNPWKGSHQDFIQYAYNHPLGDGLKQLVIVNLTPRNQDEFRQILERPIDPTNSD